MHSKNGDNMPFTIALLNSEKGLHIDAVMMGAINLVCYLGLREPTLWSTPTNLRVTLIPSVLLL